MRLEPELWEALVEICRRENIAISDLVRKVDGGREVGGRASAIRVYVFEYFRSAATEEDHRLAGGFPFNRSVRTSMAPQAPSVLKVRDIRASNVAASSAVGQPRASARVWA